MLTARKPIQGIWGITKSMLRRYGALNKQYDSGLIGQIDKIKDKAVTSDKIAYYSFFEKVATESPVTIGVAGNPVSILSLYLVTALGYKNLIPLIVKATPSGLGTAESATFTVVADTTTGVPATLASKTTPAGSTDTVVFTVADFAFDALGGQITKITVNAESSNTGTTTATATASIAALVLYI